MTPRQAVLYGRVSKQSVAEGKSVDQQFSELREIARREHVKVVAEHRDDGISASRYAGGKARTGWRAVMASVNAGECTELWVWEISRATRDRDVWAKLVTACIANNVKITVCGRVHDPADPDDGFMLDLTAALAVRESAVTSKRIKRDVKHSAQAGRVHGRIAYGYAREYDTNTGALKRQYADPVLGSIVAEIFERIVNGESGYSIAGDLNRRSVPSPHEARAARLGQTVDVPYPWTLEQVHRIVRNPTYAGLRTHDEKGTKKYRATIVGPGKWDGIVSREVFEQAQFVVEQPRRRTVTDLAVKHLLSGIAVCGVCGSIVRVIKNRGYPSYACWGGPAKRGTCCVSRRQPPVDALVAETLIELAEQPDVVERFAAHRADPAHAKALVELAELEDRLAGFLAQASRGRVSPESFATIEANLKPQIEAARARVARRQLSPQAAAFVGPGARERWKRMEDDIPARRLIVRELLQVTILKSPPDRAGVKGFDPELVDVRWREV